MERGQNTRPVELNDSFRLLKGSVIIYVIDFALF